MVTPALPDWCFEEEEVNSGGEEEDKGGDKGDKKNHKLVRKKERNNEVSSTKLAMNCECVNLGSNFCCTNKWSAFSKGTGIKT